MSSLLNDKKRNHTSILRTLLCPASRPGGSQASLALHFEDAHRLLHSPLNPPPFMQTFIQTVLYTAPGGEALFKEEPIVLDQGKPQALLSALMPSGGYQLRHSPVGFQSDFHCTTTPQWVFILQGQMEITLHSGESRVFYPGEHFYSADTPPPQVDFDPKRHGHRSRQVGEDPLVTLFLRGG